MVVATDGDDRDLVKSAAQDEQKKINEKGLKSCWQFKETDLKRQKIVQAK